MANASKIQGTELNINAISIEAMKSSDVGDKLLFIDEFGGLTLFQVDAKVATRGRKGGTSLTLSDVVGDGKLELPTTNVLPDGVLAVHKVLSGVNVRTLRNLAKAREASGAIVTDAPVNVAPVEPVSDILAPASTDVAIPQLDMSAPLAELPASEPAAPVSDKVIDFAQCGPEENISDLLAELVTL